MRRIGRKRGQTILEVLYDESALDLVRTARAWVADSSDIMLNSVWAAYDALLANPRLKTALEEATDDIERGLTRLLYFALDDILTGDEPFRLLPEAPEDESRKRPPARPRAYDIAFAMRINPRIMWSVEAKVLPTDGSLGDYVATLKSRFLTCDYAPFISEGTMAGYLLNGDAENVFAQISDRLGTRLISPTKWRRRKHRLSFHKRDVASGKPYPVRFRCHHLVMKFG